MEEIKQASQTKIDAEPLEMGVEIKLTRKVRGKGPLKEVLGEHIKHLLLREKDNQEKLYRSTMT